MRKHSLRKAVSQYLKMDRQGSFRERKQKAHVIHTMMDDLFTTTVHHAMRESMPLSDSKYRSFNVQKFRETCQPFFRMKKFLFIVILEKALA